MKATFKGGIHVAEYKNTAGCPITPLPPAAILRIPLSQHIGAPAEPVVGVGDRVLVGQVIGEVRAGLGCPVHASVSGTVREIQSRNNVFGRPIQHIVIENDGLDTPAPTVRPAEKAPEDCTPDEITECIRQAGISGMGGATFPTHAKIRSARGKVDTVLINCAECEPFITANHRLMLERPCQLLEGARVLLRALELSKVTFAIEDNKMDAVAVLRQAVDNWNGNHPTCQAEVRVMKTKYPQGDERQLIYALTGREVPTGGLPADVGCVIFNAETCASVAQAFFEGVPLIRRIVTVDGDCIAHPGNILAPIGASYADLAAACGGLCREPAKLINGGPMMGFAQWDTEGSVTKGTSALLFLSEEFIRPTLSHSACIHCGRCVEHCPMHLMPYELASFARKRDYESAQSHHVMSCVECGTCSYGCPAGVEIVQYIRVAKDGVRARMAAQRAREANRPLT